MLSRLHRIPTCLYTDLDIRGAKVGEGTFKDSEDNDVGLWLYAGIDDIYDSRFGVRAGSG